MCGDCVIALGGCEYFGFDRMRFGRFKRFSQFVHPGAFRFVPTVEAILKRDLYSCRSARAGLGVLFGRVWRAALAALIAGLAGNPLRTGLQGASPMLQLGVTPVAHRVVYLVLFAVLPGGMVDFRVFFSRVRGASIPKGFAPIPQVP